MLAAESGHRIADAFEPEEDNAALAQQAHPRRIRIEGPCKQDQVPEAWRFTGGIDQSESSSRKNLIANTPGTWLFSLGNDFLPWRDRILQVDLGFPARGYISQVQDSTANYLDVYNLQLGSSFVTVRRHCCLYAFS